MAADRQHADASRIPLCALHLRRHLGSRRRDAVRHRRCRRGHPDERDGARCHSSLDQLVGTVEGCLGSTHLGRLPLQVFDPRRRGHGTQSRAVRCGKYSKAGESGRRTLSPIYVIRKLGSTGTVAAIRGGFLMPAMKQLPLGRSCVYEFAPRHIADRKTPLVC